MKRHKKPKKSDDSDASKAATLVQRHASILGLCAFVNANPYTVPDDLPDVLMILSEHLHDPQPIPASVTVFEFRLVLLFLLCSAGSACFSGPDSVPVCVSVIVIVCVTVSVSVCRIVKCSGK